ncbi:MAG TPA: cytochrome c biogenesis protein CcsA [Bacteroidia bacterium]|jgi:heme exporter protein C|nr:cytochrome c biogenesis protein CcsA [Bacteroidia bacterium]HQK97112.1 cytochrome c biogenesis protein CcsA [Bacteroidia bacterium]
MTTKSNSISRSWWWKILAIVMLVYTFIMGFLGPVPAMPIINESIRNLYFHVTMWMAMITLMFVNVVYSLKYLSSGKLYHDLVGEESARMAMVFASAGLITGMIWANFTWGAPWVNDPQLNGTAATMLIYAAYFILRNAITDEIKRARIGSVYGIFAFVMMFVFIMIIPKMNDSLHPGKGGNPGFNKYDLDSNMRMVFYPAVIGWTLFGVWMMSLRVRLRKIEEKIHNA